MFHKKPNNSFHVLDLYLKVAILQTFLGNCLVVGIYKYRLHGVIVMKELTMNEVAEVNGGNRAVATFILGILASEMICVIREVPSSVRTGPRATRAR